MLCSRGEQKKNDANLIKRAIKSLIAVVHRKIEKKEKSWENELKFEHYQYSSLCSPLFGTYDVYLSKSRFEL